LSHRTSDALKGRSARMPAGASIPIAERFS
jgi:hypothetical protein